MCQTHRHHRNRTQNQHQNIGFTWPPCVTQMPHDQTRDDGRGHRSNDDIAHLILGQPQLLPNGRHQWRQTKPRKKAQKK